jgi:hypothetical protein
MNPSELHASVQKGATHNEFGDQTLLVTQQFDWEFLLFLALCYRQSSPMFASAFFHLLAIRIR